MKKLFPNGCPLKRARAWRAFLRISKKVLLDAGGALRRWVKLLLALAALLLAAWAVPLGLTALFQALFSAWGVTAETVSRAPGWAQALYGGWLYVNGLTQGAAMALAAWGMGRALNERVRMGKGTVLGLAAGALATVALILSFRLLDVARFGHALSKPAFSVLTPMLLFYVLAQALGAALAAGLIGKILAGWRRALAFAGCAAAYWALFGRWTAFGAVNGALFGLLLWGMYEKKGGVAPAFGFLAMFSALTNAVFGMPPWQQGALYETYQVSKPWLTGGELGPWAGLGMMVILALFTLAWALQSRRTKAAPPPPPAKGRPSGKS
jgi:hypothetical protein